MLLSGDLFDGPCSADGAEALRAALAEVKIPVFITPGNHDFCSPDSPWLTRSWPGNVYIFTRPVMEAVDLPALDCRIYGAGFLSMDCPGLLEGFHAEGSARYHIGVLHGDPTQTDSPYCPVTTAQVRDSALDYLALGHIHKGDTFRAGDTLCGWPGCPMGRGYDETGAKGVLIVEIDTVAQARFCPLDTPRFYDLEVPAEPEAVEAIASVLPPVGNSDHYRITLTGPSDPLDLGLIGAEFSRFPNLELRDRTVPKADIWGAADDDTLEGVFFRNLKQALDGADEDTRRRILLAAKIARQILDGQEVKLP